MVTCCSRWLLTVAALGQAHALLMIPHCGCMQLVPEMCARDASVLRIHTVRLFCYLVSRLCMTAKDACCRAQESGK